MKSPVYTITHEGDLFSITTPEGETTLYAEGEEQARTIAFTLLKGLGHDGAPIAEPQDDGSLKVWLDSELTGL